MRIVLVAFTLISVLSACTIPGKKTPEPAPIVPVIETTVVDTMSPTPETVQSQK